MRSPTTEPVCPCVSARERWPSPGRRRGGVRRRAGREDECSELNLKTMDGTAGDLVICLRVRGQQQPSCGLNPRATACTTRGRTQHACASRRGGKVASTASVNRWLGFPNAERMGSSRAVLGGRALTHRCSRPAVRARRSCAAPGNPERRRQGQGEEEVAAQLELARDQESLGAGGSSDQPQERHRFELERQRRLGWVASRCPAPAVDKRELIAVDATVSPAGDSELHDRVGARVRLCALTDRAEDLPQHDAAKPAAHDRPESPL